MVNDIRIVDVEANSRQNGIGTYIRALVPALKESGRTVSLVSLNSGEAAFTVGERLGCVDHRFPTADYNARADEFCRLLSGVLPNSPGSAFIVNYTPCLGFVRALRSRFPSSRVVAVVHDQGWTSSLLGKAPLFRDILVEGRCPDIVSRRTFDHVRRYSAGERDYYSLCHAVVSLSPQARGVMVGTYGVDASKVRLIPNCIGSPLARVPSALRRRSREAFGIRPGEKVLLYAGRPVAAKGFGVLLRAFALLRLRRADVRLVVAGRLSDVSRFEWLVRPVAPWLVLAGLVPHGEVMRWYAAADVGVLPSYTEQCSFTGLEMMARRLPVVASDGHCVSDMFTPGVNAVTAHIPDDPLDDESYAASLADALDDALSMGAVRRRAMLGAATRRVLTDYSPQAFTAGYSALFDTL